MSCCPPLTCKAEGEGLDNDFEPLRIKTHVPVGTQLPKHFSSCELILTCLLKIKNNMTLVISCVTKYIVIVGTLKANAAGKNDKHRLSQRIL